MRAAERRTSPPISANSREVEARSRSEDGCGQHLWKGAAAALVQRVGRSGDLACRAIGRSCRMRQFAAPSGPAGAASSMRREHLPAENGMRAIRHSAHGRAAGHAAE